MDARGKTTAAVVGRNIRAELARQDHSQAWLGEQIGMTQAQVSTRLRGVVPIDINELVVIAAALNIDLTDLLAGAARNQNPEEGIKKC